MYRVSACGPGELRRQASIHQLVGCAGVLEARETDQEVPRVIPHSGAFARTTKALRCGVDAWGVSRVERVTCNGRHSAAIEWMLRGRGMDTAPQFEQIKA